MGAPITVTRFTASTRLPGALTAIGTSDIGGGYADFGSTTSGLYAFGGDGNLYSIDPTTGAATEIGPTGLSFGGTVMGMSSGSSALYLTQNNSLYSLNTTNGSATLIGTTNEGESGFGALVSVGGTLYGGAYGASTPDIYTFKPPKRRRDIHSGITKHSILPRRGRILGAGTNPTTSPDYDLRRGH